MKKKEGNQEMKHAVFITSFTLHALNKNIKLKKF